MNSSQTSQKRYHQIKKLLDDLIEGLFFYTDDARHRLNEAKGNDPLTEKKLTLSKELRTNLMEIRSQLTENNLDNILQAMKYHYTSALNDHEKILNEMPSYYLLGYLFKNIGYLWGSLGQCLDEGANLVSKELGQTSQTTPPTLNKKNITPENQFNKMTVILDDLILGLLNYKESVWKKMQDAKTIDALAGQKHRLSQKLWQKLSELKIKLTPQNADDLFLEMKSLYIHAHKEHENILNDIISTSYTKYLPQSVSTLLNSYASPLSRYLGTFWAGDLGKEISKGPGQISLSQPSASAAANSAHLSATATSNLNNINTTTSILTPSLKLAPSKK